MEIYTIGHSNTSFDALAALLKQHGVETVVDVRSAPYSRYAQHFNHDMLEAQLMRVEIGYEFMGDRLGGKPSNRALLKPDGNPDYERMAATEYFQDGLAMLQRMAQDSVVCLMCSEEDPAHCHRSRLLATRLTAAGVDVLHIRKHGNIETEADAAARRITAKDRQMELF